MYGEQHKFPHLRCIYSLASRRKFYLFCFNRALETHLFYYMSKNKFLYDPFKNFYIAELRIKSRNGEAECNNLKDKSLAGSL